MREKKEPYIFGIRHLSPAGAWHLLRFLEEKKPGLVLVEGPSDFADMIEDLVRTETKPPVAILAYTRQLPVRTVLYPLAEYSPEYQAIRWCHKNKVVCQFMDLPSDVILALPQEQENNAGNDPDMQGVQGDPDGTRKDNSQTGQGETLARGRSDDSNGQNEQNGARERGSESIYEKLDRLTGEDGQEMFWERIAEHTLDTEGYHLGSNLFGEKLRELCTESQNQKVQDQPREVVPHKVARETEDVCRKWNSEQWEEIRTLLREAYMCRKIQDALAEGYQPEEIVVVTGSYHVAGLRERLRNGQTVTAKAEKEEEEELEKQRRISTGEPDDKIFENAGMTDEEICRLPRVETNHTLMPYSYYRLSSRSGYGAGNQAPAYYELLWRGMKHQDLWEASHRYLAGIAGYQRAHGTPVSSAEVIEAVRLAKTLAVLRGGRVPALRDLRDSAITCLGHGSFAEISLAVAQTEIGKKIGSLPEGVSRTCIQEDFYRNLRELKLEKYQSLSAEELNLDLRENRNVVSEKSAFLDLHRSFFLHRLRVLGVSFGSLQTTKQENATWAERWTLAWTPEAEIELVETALIGDTIVQAVALVFQERTEHAKEIGEIALVIEDAFLCGMERALSSTVGALQAIAIDEVAIRELAVTVHRLSTVVQYRNIRNIHTEMLIPVMQQMFYRACLILAQECKCDDSASKSISEAMDQLNQAQTAHGFLNAESWVQALKEVAERDDLNPRLSGYASAILLERGLLSEAELGAQIQRRLSNGIPAELGAGWFEGLSMKNRYALIARLSIWKNLDEYLDTLDEKEFKKALVFLRRAFADFNSGEKDEIAENLGEIWGLNGQQVSETVNAVLETEEQDFIQELAQDLGDFDFDF